MVRIVWIDSSIEDLNAIGESLVELPRAKAKAKAKEEKEIVSRISSEVI